MQQFINKSLKSLNTFAINATSPLRIELNSSQELVEVISSINDDFYVMGQGSNTLFIDDYSPIILQPNFKGVTVRETASHYLLDIAAGENWHELVTSTVDQDIYGLENLALIPGCVGAAPIQNIGAYGVEIANFCQSVTWFDFQTLSTSVLDKEACKFGYRDSIFKGQLKGKGLITQVQLVLPKKWKPLIAYAGLNELNESATAAQVMDKVIALRQAKLPDPNDIANAGSFFKNPVVSTQQFDTLLKAYPEMPYYRLDNYEVKLAAGWLIEKAGLKGYRKSRCGVHEKQALVLVNLGGATGRDILKLAQFVVQDIKEKFSITLTPEVRMIGAQGEVSFEEIPAYV